MQAELEDEYVEYVTARLAALRRFAFLLCGDEHRADDLVQQTITELYERGGGPGPSASSTRPVRRRWTSGGRWASILPWGSRCR